MSPFDLPRLEAEYKELHDQMNQAGFWDDIDKANKVSQKAKQIENKVNRYKGLLARCEDTYTLIEMAVEEEDLSLLDEVIAEVRSIGEATEKLRLELLLKGPYDGQNAVLSLHAGAGGTEAQDWVSMLFRMYSRYCEKQGWAVKVLDQLDGDEAGIKSVTFEVDGENAYGYLKAEAGVHRLVRISPFDASGRRHTSFASLDVTPVVEDDGDIVIDPDDLRIDTYRASGAGGQHVNKTSSAIRITTCPPASWCSARTSAASSRTKRPPCRCCAASSPRSKSARKWKKMAALKGEMKKIEWGSQIRSYVFQPYTLVKDHRTGVEAGNIDAVMDGEIGQFIDTYLARS